MKYILTVMLCIASNNIFCQFDHEAVFPDLNDNELLEALISNFKTDVVLSYGEARDTFMANIDSKENKLECVYTGYTITLDPIEDPTINAFSQGINTEHTYPRSKGALENTLAYSDMHHLFPSRENVNSDRGSLPFLEVIDTQTDKWYLDDNIQNGIPQENIDSYSELLTNEAFEPREQHKGDVARAYFYFYTMYRDQANSADPDFFPMQQETLCDWHFSDPVDEKEWKRNEGIAIYQDNKKNPFILDCRLARLYCDEIVGSCTTVSTFTHQSTQLKVRPNPASDYLFLDFGNEKPVKFRIITIQGLTVGSGFIDFNESVISIDISNLKSGLYILQVGYQDGGIGSNTKFLKP